MPDEAGPRAPESTLPKKAPRPRPDRDSGLCIGDIAKGLRTVKPGTCMRIAGLRRHFGRCRHAPTSAARPEHMPRCRSGISCQMAC